MIENYLLFKQLLGVLLFIDLLMYTPMFNIYFGRGYENDSSGNKKTYFKSDLYFLAIHNYLFSTKYIKYFI